MAKGPRYTVKFRREREGKTDYKKRLAFLKSGKIRIAVRISNKNILCQAIKYDGKMDSVIASATSEELVKDFGWKGAGANIPASYLVGYLCAKKTVKAKEEEAILDTGFAEIVKGSKVFAALKGAIDGGLTIPHKEDVLPPEERLTGAHIDEKMKTKVADAKKKIDSKF